MRYNLLTNIKRKKRNTKLYVLRKRKKIDSTELWRDVGSSREEKEPRGRISGIPCILYLSKCNKYPSARGEMKLLYRRGPNTGGKFAQNKGGRLKERRKGVRSLLL